MNETPLWADMPTDTTVERQGSKIVRIKTSGQKNNVPVCFAAKADSTKSTKVKPNVALIRGAADECLKYAWMNDWPFSG